MKDQKIIDQLLQAVGGKENVKIMSIVPLDYALF